MQNSSDATGLNYKSFEGSFRSCSLKPVDLLRYFDFCFYTSWRQSTQGAFPVLSIMTSSPCPYQNTNIPFSQKWWWSLKFPRWLLRYHRCSAARWSSLCWCGYGEQMWEAYTDWPCNDWLGNFFDFSQIKFLWGKKSTSVVFVSCPLCTSLLTAAVSYRLSCQEAEGTQTPWHAFRFFQQEFISEKFKS